MGIFKKIAEIFRKIAIGYVFYTFLLTLIGFLIIVSYSLPYSPVPPEDLSKFFNDVILNNPICIIAAIQLAIWILISFLFSITMFFSRTTEKFLLKNFQE